MQRKSSLDRFIHGGSAIKSIRQRVVVLSFAFCCAQFAGCATRPVQVAVPEQKVEVVSVASEVAPLPTALQDSLPPQDRQPEVVAGLPAPQIEQPAGQPEPVEPQVVYVEKTLLPDARFFDNRREMYRELDTRWQGIEEEIGALGIAPPAQWQSCRETLKAVAAGYRTVTARDQDATGQPSNFWDVLWADMRFIEGDCPAVTGEAQQIIDDALKQYAEVNAGLGAALIRGHIMRAEGQRAESAYERLLPVFADQKPSKELLKLYANILVRQQNPAEAARVLLVSLEGEPHTIENVSLRREAADLLLAAGDRTAARGQYQLVAGMFRNITELDGWVKGHLAFLDAGPGQDEQLTAYKEVLLAYYAQQGEGVTTRLRDAVGNLVAQYPESLLSVQARGLVSDAESTVRSRMDGQIAEARSLVDIGEYRAARDILRDLMQKTLPPATEQIVLQELRAVDLAEAESRQVVNQYRQDQIALQFEDAVRFFDQGKYDEAIVAFAVLRGTSYEKEAADKTRTAMDRAATERRREAADLYLKARKTTDPGRKRQLIADSLGILRDIVRKYPEAGIIDKVAQNIQVLQNELTVFGVDPATSR